MLYQDTESSSGFYIVGSISAYIANRATWENPCQGCLWRRM